MNYQTPLIEGLFLKRYKRFFADVKLGRETVVAHVPNTGSLKTVCDLGERKCRMLKSDDPKRKLAYTLEQIETPTGWVGVNTHRANTLVWEAFQARALAHWKQYTVGQPEFSISKETRFDFRLQNEATGECRFVEVKSVTLGNGGLAQFPDAVTTRGQKHLRELMALKRAGHSAEILFVIQRTDCHEFSPADHIDPEYGRLLRDAVRDGVVAKAYPVTLSGDRIELDISKEINLKL